MKKLLISSLAIGALTLMGGAAQAVQNIYLIAKPLEITLPDGSALGRKVTMWGFAPDSANGDCYKVKNGLKNTKEAKDARLVHPSCTGPVATVPGPALNFNGDNIVKIYLTNLLPEPVSIVIPGQEKPFSFPNNGPTWTDGSKGPSAGGAPGTRRVRSFGREAGKNGGRLKYFWTNFRNNPFKVGSYIYHSGTHPQVQVQMGLYGSINKNEAAGVAYSGIPYDHEVSLFYSEVDPELHDAVDPVGVGAPTYGTPNGPTSTIGYQPKYYLVNGKPFTTKPDATLAGGVVGARTLVRMYNMGYENHNLVLNNLRMDIVAEDGRPYTYTDGATTNPYPHNQYSALLPAGKTKDAIIAPATAGTYAVYDGMLGLGNVGSATGGMVNFLEVAP